MRHSQVRFEEQRNKTNISLQNKTKFEVEKGRVLTTGTKNKKCTRQTDALINII